MKYFYLFAWVLLPFLVYASNDPLPMGAGALSLGRAYTGVRGNLWSLGYNPAGMAGLQQAQAGFYAERRFGLKELTYGGVAFAMPFKDKHYVGAEVGSFGYSNYRETKVSAAYATTLFQILHIGTKLNMATVSIPELGSTTAAWLDLGLNVNVSEKVNFGFNAYNVNQAKIRTQNERQAMPTVVTAGVCYQVSDKVMIVGDVQKNLMQTGFSYRGGLQYRVYKGFTARMGATTLPTSLNFGAGYEWKDKFVIDIATSIHERLGFTPAFALGWKFGKKKAEKMGGDE